MADIKEIGVKTVNGVKSAVRSPWFLAACGLGVIALLWDSAEKKDTGTTYTDMSEAAGYSGYPDISGDVSTMADNTSVALQEMQDNLNDTLEYLTQREQERDALTAEQFEQMEEKLDTHVSNLQTVQREEVDALKEDYTQLREQVEKKSSGSKSLVSTAVGTATAVGIATALKSASQTTKPTTTKTNTSKAQATASDTFTYTQKSGLNTSTSISDALKAAGGSGSYAERQKIAAANGIKNYTGTAAQNVQMLNALKAGTLKKA